MEIDLKVLTITFHQFLILPFANFVSSAQKHRDIKKTLARFMSHLIIVKMSL